MKAKKKKEFRIYVDEEHFEAILNYLERRGETRTEWFNRISRESISKDSAMDGLDVITLAVRKAMRDVLKPAEDRLAKLAVKAGIAGATSMYMNMQVIQDAGDHDAIDIYNKSRKKAVEYIKLPEDDLR